MFELMARNWWVVALRGLLAVLFGLIVLIWPGPSLLVFVILFGAFALVDGVASLVALFTGRRERTPWWVLLLQGVIGIGAGLVAFLWPDITALAMLYVIAFWAILIGVLEIIAAIQLRSVIQSEWLLGLGGVASVLFGLVLVIFPDIGLLTLVLLVGIYALIIGVLLLLLGFRLRSMRGEARGVS